MLEPSIDQPTPYAKKALLASVVGYAMDGFDLLLLGFILQAISKDLPLSPLQAGSLLTWTLFGAVTGGIFFGILSDYLGRIRVLSWTILVFAVFTGLCALAQGYWSLVACRFIAGLGLGGEFGIGMALVAESWPAAKRARVSAYVGLGWQVGVIAAALLTPLLLPLIGWRGMFLVGIIPAVAAFLIRYLAKEPELFVAHHAKKRFPLRHLIKDAATIKLTFASFILCAVHNFGYYGVMIWLPTYLSNQFGFPFAKSALWTAVTIIGMGLGIWSFGICADRFGRRPTFVFWQCGAAIMVVVFSTLITPNTLLIGGAIMGFFINGMLGGLGALISELFPTAARATAQNVIFNLGRAVGGIGPVIVPLTAMRYSFPTAIALLSILYIIELVVTLTMIPERKGAALE